MNEKKERGRKNEMVASGRWARRIKARRKNGKIRGKSAKHTMFPWQKRLVYHNHY